MDFEPRRLLLLHQSAAAYRRGNHSLYRACTTSHRVCTAAGNDCVTCSEEQTPCTDTRPTDIIQSLQMQFHSGRGFHSIKVLNLLAKPSEMFFFPVLRSAFFFCLLLFLKMQNKVLPDMTTLYKRYEYKKLITLCTSCHDFFFFIVTFNY